MSSTTTTTVAPALASADRLRTALAALSDVLEETDGTTADVLQDNMDEVDAAKVALALALALNAVSIARARAEASPSDEALRELGNVQRYMAKLQQYMAQQQQKQKQMVQQ